MWSEPAGHSPASRESRMRHGTSVQAPARATQLGAGMAIDTIAQRLLDLEVFRGIGPEKLERLAREADRIIFRDGQTIAAAGAEADGAFVLVAGCAMALADPERGVPAHRIEAGSMIAETAMLTEHHFGLTITADGDVRAIKITRELLRTMMLEDAALRDHFAGRIAARLTRVAIELRLIDERLAAAIAA